MEAPRRAPRFGPLGSLGERLGRHAGIYAFGSVLGLALSIVNVAILTRLLDLDEFGQYALLLMFAAMLTVVQNLVFLQGTLLRTFGAADEEGGGGDEGPGPAADGSIRRILGTGLIATAAVVGLWTAAAVLLAPQIAELLLGDADLPELVILAAVSGGLAAIWRLAVNVLRFERKAITFVVMNVLRPILVLGVVIPLVLSGEGLWGAIAGQAIGNGVALLITLLWIRRSFLLSLDTSALPGIVRTGAVFVPIIAGFWFTGNADLYLLSREVDDAEVGAYRVASRIGVGVSYFTGAIFMAWGPLRRTPIFAAAQKERGTEGVGAPLVTYYTLVLLWLLLGITLAADLLIRIAPPDYWDAAYLIPLLAGGLGLHGILIAIYRSTGFRYKRLVYIGSALGGAGLLTASAAFLIPRFEATGAALSVMVAFGIPAVVMGTVAQLLSPVLEPRRLLPAVVFAATCGALGLLGQDSLEVPWGAVSSGAALVAYPVLLLATGVVPRDAIRTVLLMGRRAFVPRPERDDATTRLQALPEDQQHLLARLIELRRGRTIRQEHVPSDNDQVLAVRALRRYCEIGEADELDLPIGAYLFSRASVAERNAIARALIASGADPRELDELEQAILELGGLPTSAWRMGGPGSTRDEASAPIAGDAFG